MNYPRGSEWRKWDLHVHTPEDAEWINRPDLSTEDNKIKTAREYVAFAKKKNISVLGITDHNFCSDLKDSILPHIQIEAKKEDIVIFPGFEIAAKDGSGIHLLILFPEEADLKVIKSVIDQCFPPNTDLTPNNGQIPVSNKSIDEIKKVIDESGLDSIFIFAHIDRENGVLDPATIQGTRRVQEWKKRFINISQLSKTPESYAPETFMSKVLNEQDANYKRSMTFITASDCRTIVESDKIEGRCYLGEKFTWIKADPTLEGLKQIIYEPKERVFIGDEPEVEERVRSNKTKYINSIAVNNVDGYRNQNGKWFKEIVIELNKGLIAIIGNKGSGKSAITDIIGLLGNTRNQKVRANGFDEELFSFLNKKKFRKIGFASNFTGTLKWESGNDNSNNLDGDVDNNLPELVEYLPQKYLEKICTDIDDEEFRKKLNEVIFEYIEDKDKFGTLNLDELVSYLAEQTHREINEIILRLHEKNTEIVAIEKKLTVDYEKQVSENIKVKKNEIEAHKKNEPQKINPPTGNEAIKKGLQTTLSALEVDIQKIQTDINGLLAEQITFTKDVEDARKAKQAIKSGVENLLGLEKSYVDLFKRLGLSFGDLIQVKFDQAALDKLIENKTTRLTEIEKLLISDEEVKSLKLDNGSEIKIIKDSLTCQLKEKKDKKKEITDQLGKPARDYQEYVKNKENWDTQLKKLEGGKNEPEIGTLNWLAIELTKIKNIYPGLRKELFTQREEIVKEIFEKKKEVVKFYESIKKSIDEEIFKNTDKLQGYNISIDAGLRFDPVFIEDFFNYINQSVTGSFYGIESGKNALKGIFDKYDDWNDVENVISVLNNVVENLDTDQREETSSEKKANNIFKQMKLGKDPIQFYDYLFGLEYLESKYDLKVDDKDLSTLSPGERGGLLLVFYLMLDKRDIPLIIDQPEDNLDNESVYKILVTFIKKAKKHRQIIMATHNPNLAVVADAEQIIQVEIDKQGSNKFNFHSGSIENLEINKKIVDILEGTMPAFDIRRLKYLKQRK